MAHSAIIHTDLPFATVFFIGAYFFWRSLGQFNWLNLILTSLGFGLAVIAKFSYIWVLPVWTALGLIKIYRSEPLECSIGALRSLTSRWSKAGLLGVLVVISGAVAYLVLWAAYEFRYHATPGVEHPLVTTELLPESVFLQNLVRVITDYQFFPEAWIYG